MTASADSLRSAEQEKRANNFFPDPSNVPLVELNPDASCSSADQLWTMGANGHANVTGHGHGTPHGVFLRGPLDGS